MTAGAQGRVLVVLPAWNERESLPSVLQELTASPLDVDLLVVDDGSTDGTADAVRASGSGALVVSMPFNVGVGGAMRAGFLHAYRQGYRAVVQVDADGQHDPADVPQLLALLDDGHDIVIGARFAGGGHYDVRGPRWWAMRVLAASLSRITRTRLTDVTSGFRASGPRAIELFAREYPPEYLGDTVESLVLASRAGLRVGQVPVSMRVRRAGQPSQSRLRASVYVGRAALVLVLSVLHPRPKQAPA